MKSSIISVSEILNSAKRFLSAGFSIGYSFDETNAAEYFEELIDNASYPSPIFSGILIVERDENEITIIDGLQRLTTISILLCALCECYKGTSEKNEESKNKVLTRYLLDGKKPKLNLLNKEQLIYNKILFGEELNEDEKSSNMVKTYECFLEKIKEHRITGTTLFRIIARIQFMLIVTSKSEISSTDLYQILNNKEKTQINLISDFIWQKDKAAGTFWQTLVNQYSNDFFENFIRDFLIIQNDGKMANKAALYNYFKKYYNKISKYREAATIVENIAKYSMYYQKITNADFEDQRIKEQIKILKETGGQEAYPYLMEVMDDLENGHIDLDVFFDILTMINSFIKSTQENSLSKVTINFASLSKELNKMLVLKNYEPKIIDENKLTINEMNNS